MEIKVYQGSSPGVLVVLCVCGGGGAVAALDEILRLAAGEGRGLLSCQMLERVLQAEEVRR